MVWGCRLKDNTCIVQNYSRWTSTTLSTVQVPLHSRKSFTYKVVCDITGIVNSGDDYVFFTLLKLHINKRRRAATACGGNTYWCHAHIVYCTSSLQKGGGTDVINTFQMKWLEVCLIDVDSTIYGLVWGFENNGNGLNMKLAEFDSLCRYLLKFIIFQE